MAGGETKNHASLDCLSRDFLWCTQFCFLSFLAMSSTDIHSSHWVMICCLLFHGFSSTPFPLCSTCFQTQPQFWYLIFVLFRSSVILFLFCQLFTPNFEFYFLGVFSVVDFVVGVSGTEWFLKLLVGFLWGCVVQGRWGACMRTDLRTGRRLKLRGSSCFQRMGRMWKWQQAHFSDCRTSAFQKCVQGVWSRRGSASLPSVLIILLFWTAFLRFWWSLGNPFLPSDFLTQFLWFCFGKVVSQLDKWYFLSDFLLFFLVDYLIELNWQF